MHKQAVRYFASDMRNFYKKQIHYSNRLINLETDNLHYKIFKVWTDLWQLNCIVNLTTLLDIQCSYGKHDFKFFLILISQEMFNTTHLILLIKVSLKFSHLTITLHFLSFKNNSPPISAPFHKYKTHFGKNRVESGSWDYLFLFCFQEKCKGLQITEENMKPYTIYMSKDSTDGAWHKGDSVVWVKEKLLQTFLHNWEYLSSSGVFLMPGKKNILLLPLQSFYFV